ncbi:MAG: pre-16S rRNA-processing nuclease YqgF [Firmicutes bacterium]|nr:pre-16S rRNA-processing nuclease YqgF [Bacillota bacterium]
MDKAKREFKYIIAIDPGTEKCGLAVVSIDGEIRLQEIVREKDLLGRVRGVARHYSPALVVVGDRTGAERFMELVEQEGIAELVAGVEAIDEHLTSQEARRYYLEERRRAGSWLYRIIPLGMQVPDQPYDDYVAVILARRYLGL